MVRMLAHSKTDGQVAVLRLRVPDRRAFGQPQLGATAAGLPLLARQPVAQRVDQVIVGELIVSLALAARAASLARSTFRVSRRDQPQFGVEDADHVVEVLGRSA